MVFGLVLLLPWCDLRRKRVVREAARQQALEQGAQTLAGYLPPAAPDSPTPRLLMAETDDGWLGLLLVDPAQTYTSPQAAQILGRSPDWTELGLLPGARKAGAGWLIPVGVGQEKVRQAKHSVLVISHQRFPSRHVALTRPGN
jgi:hypothetical protein